jgi:hypothetical protein
MIPTILVAASAIIFIVWLECVRRPRRSWEEPVQPPTAHLHGAYVWDCEHCGRENWTRQIRLDKPVRCGCGCGMKSNLVRVKHAASVRCRHCGRVFSAEED